MNVLILSGSLRADSHNRQLAAAAARMLPQGSHAVFADLAGLPAYSEDLDVEGRTPASVVALREQITAADALIVATPEYNGSIPGALKNAIDWASRPRGAASTGGKPVAVIGASMSPYAAQWARQDAVRILGVAGAKPLEATVGLGASHEVFGAGGTLPAETAASLQSLVTELVVAAHAVETVAA